MSKKFMNFILITSTFMLTSFSVYSAEGDLYDKCFKIAKEGRFLNWRAEGFCKKADKNAVNCIEVTTEWWFSPERADRICTVANIDSAICLRTSMDMWLGRNRAERMCTTNDISLVSKCLNLANKTPLKRKNIELICTNATDKSLKCLQSAINNEWGNRQTGANCSNL